jgi:hypothetical protein
MFSFWQVFHAARTMQVVVLLLVSLVLCAAPPTVRADGFYYGSGSASWTFDGGLFPGSVVSDGSFIPSTLAPGIQWSHTFQNGLNEASAQQGLGWDFTQDSLRFAIAPGTGLSQSAPDGGNTPATFDINFNINAESHGRNGESLRDIIGWYNLPLTAVVPEGSWVSASFTVTFRGIIGTYAEPNYAMVFEETLSGQWTKNTAGTEEHTLADSVDLPDLMGEYGAGWPGYAIDITGTLNFTVKNDGGPVSIDLRNGFSLQSQGTTNPGGPEWVSPTGGNWGETSNWMPQAVPDAPDAIATLGPWLTSAGTIDLESTNRTVGTLGFAAVDAPYTIVATGSTPGTLSLQSTSGNALVRFAVYNEQDHEIAAPVKLLSDTTFGMGLHTLTLSNSVDFDGHGILIESGSLVLSGGSNNGGYIDVSSDATVMFAGGTHSVSAVTGMGHMLVSDGVVNATSIQMDTLSIGNPMTQAVPEPSTFFLLMMCSILLIYCWCRRRG